MVQGLGFIYFGHPPPEEGVGVGYLTEESKTLVVLVSEKDG
jgi:hypothetical protein